MLGLVKSCQSFRHGVRHSLSCYARFRTFSSKYGQRMFIFSLPCLSALLDEGADRIERTRDVKPLDRKLQH